MLALAHKACNPALQHAKIDKLVQADEHYAGLSAVEQSIARTK